MHSSLGSWSNSTNPLRPWLLKKWDAHFVEIRGVLRAAGGEYVGAAIVASLLFPRALPGGDEAADVGGEEADGVVRNESARLAASTWEPS